tara:strand:+ start:199 stop:420 length:222 start_codon:yes stop_codon:yes gene_type:complete
LGNASLSEFTIETERQVCFVTLSRSHDINIIKAESSLPEFFRDKNGQNIWAGQFNSILQPKDIHDANNRARPQ